MMNLNFNNVEEKKTSPFLSPGTKLLLKINDITLDESKNNPGQYRPVFFMESAPIDDPTFVGVDGAKGKIGKVSANAGYYLKNDNNVQEFMGGLKSIARALGKSDELATIEAPNLPALIEKVKPILRGEFARYFVAGKEFPKPNSPRPGIKLVFPNRNFVESKDADPSVLPEFDRNNPKHYDKIPNTQQAPPKKDKGDDLPF